jgi:hypothetical protein
MAEVLCVYRQVKILRQAAVSKTKPPWIPSFTPAWTSKLDRAA